MQIRFLMVLGSIVAMGLMIGCANLPNEQAAIDHYVRAKLLVDQQELDAALVELAKAIRNDPKLSIAHATAGDVHRKRGNWELARRSYEDACKTNPYAFRAHYNLGLSYQTLALAAKTAKHIQGFLRMAVKVYLRANIIDPDDFDTNLNLSACYFQLGKYDLAEQYCKSAITGDPNNSQAYSNLGIICDSQNRLYDAIKAYKASLEIDTHQPKLLLNLGSTYMRQNRLKRAIRAFELAKEEDPDDPAPWEQIGSCLYRTGNYPGAMEAYQKAISMGGGSAAAHRGVGVVYMTRYVLDHDKTELRDKALAAWHTSLEIEPNQNDLQTLVQKYAPQYTGPML